MSGFYHRVYSWLGWKRVGEIPRDIKKMVIIAAPHTSWHDFYMALLYRKFLVSKSNLLVRRSFLGGLLAGILEK